MPSQRPVVIPPHAILSPEFAAEYGRPLLAWHVQSGKISVGGGGLGFSPTGPRLRGAADSTTSLARGGAFCSGNNSSINFGTSKALEFGAGDAWTMWACVKPTQTTGSWFHPVGYFGTDGAGNYGGYLMQLDTNNKINIYCQPLGATFPSFISNAGAYDTTIQTFMASINLNIGSPAGYQGVWRNGAAVANTASNTPATPGYSQARIMIGNYYQNLSNFPAYMYAAAIWKGAKPQRMAEMLDRDPALMWWWPGKYRRKVFIVPAPAGQPLIVRYGGSQVLGDGQFVPSGRRGW